MGQQQQSTYMNQQSPIAAAPVPVQPIASQSIHAQGTAQNSVVSQGIGGPSGGAFRKRLNSFLDDEQAAAADAAEEVETGLSKEEMLKNAKERKKVAKNNFNYKKGV